MVKRIYITGVKIFAIAMLIYSGYLFFLLLPSAVSLTVGISYWTYLNLSKNLFELDLSGPFNMALPLIAFISLLLVALAYIIAAIGILRLKKWARTIGFYSSCIAIIVSFVAWLGVVSLSRYIASMVPCDIEYIMLGSFYAIFLYLTLPSLFILVFITRREIKQCFEKEVIQESKGITIFVTLFSILILPGIIQNYEEFASIFNIPELYLSILFWLDKTICITAAFALLGLFSLKDIFRKIAIATVLCYIALSFPTLYLIDTSEIPYIVFVVAFIVFTILDIAFIYFFTRPKVKEQFQKTLPWAASTTLFRSICAKCPP